MAWFRRAAAPTLDIEALTTAVAETVKASMLALPAGANVYQPLPRDPYDAGNFGPGIPLVPVGLDPRVPNLARPEPRRSEFQTSVNLQVSREATLVPFQVLRDVAEKVDVIRSCIKVRQSQILALDWDIVLTAQAVKRVMADDAISSPGKASQLARQRFEPQMAALRSWWEKPDRFNGQDFAAWMTVLLEEQLVLDAASLYPRRKLSGEVVAIEILDGATVKPLLDHRGSTPAPPSPAYQQILYGFPRGEFTASDTGTDDGYLFDQLVYRPRHLRTWSPYGKSEVEVSLAAADLYLKRMSWIRGEFTDGTTPDTWLELPDTSKLLPDQIRAFEAAINAELSGQDAERRKLRMLPPGARPTAMKNFSESYHAMLDEYLIKLMCACFDVMPTQIGFTPNTGIGGKGHQEGEANCYASDTEVLTDNGWKHFADITPEHDRLATRNPKTGAFEWEFPTDLTVAAWDGDLIGFRAKGVDLLVTPNHRMLARNAGRSANEFFVRADEAEHRPLRLPLTSTWEGVDPAPVRLTTPGGLASGGDVFRQRGDRLYDPLVFAAVLGAFIAEGSVMRNADGLPVAVSIAQRPTSKGFQPFKEVLAMLRARDVWHSGNAFIINDRALAAYCAELGGSAQKHIPREVLNWSTPLLETLWEYYWFGDGWSDGPTGERRRCATVSRQLADDLQELAQKIGFSSSIRVRPGVPFSIQRPVKLTRGRGGRPANPNPVPADVYYLEFRRSETTHYAARREHYQGDVYCATVPNGTLYVRRNGLPVWCGNSAARKAVRPTCRWIENLLTDISRDYLGMPAELEFKLLGYEIEDQDAAEKVIDSTVRGGRKTVNEGRSEQGLALFDFPEADEPFLVTGSGLVFLRGAIAGQAAAAGTAPPPAESGAPGPLPTGSAPPSSALDPRPADHQPAGPAATDGTPQVGDPIADTATVPDGFLRVAGHLRRKPGAVAEAAKFVTFARNRTGNWRDFQFADVDLTTAARFNAAGRAGDMDLIKALAVDVGKALPGL